MSGQVEGIRVLGMDIRRAISSVLLSRVRFPN